MIAFVESKYQKDGENHINQFEVSCQLIDQLVEVNSIDMDDAHKIVKTTTLTEPIDTFIPSEDSAYIILDEVFEKTDSTLAYKRTIYDRGESHYGLLYFQNEYHIVSHESYLKIEFDS